jgi:thiol-disulfide isomerase/thioredoxin
LANRNKQPALKGTRKGAQKAAGQGPPWLWMGLIALVVVAGVIAIVASRGGGGSKATVRTAGVEETRPVQVAGTALPPLPDSGPDPAVGKPIAEVKGASFDGTPVSIGPDGKPKVIVFVAHWCPHCQREVPVLVGYLRAHPLPADVELVAVATSTSPDKPNYPPSAWLKTVGWPGRVLADSANSDAAAAFGLTSFPYFVTVDASGNIVARAAGELTTDRIAQLIAGVSR